MNTIHLHVFPLQRQSTDYALLSVAEQTRAARFAFDLHRDRFIAGRATLRRLIGVIRAEPAAGLDLRAGHAGKPFIAGGPHFNLSHTGDLAALAIADFELGIDIERIRPIEPDIASRLFSPDEVASLDALPHNAWLDGFYACWTRKEAFIKASGDGMAIPLDSFSVTLAPGHPAKLLRMDGDPTASRRWSLHDFTPATGIAGAIAAAYPDLHVVTHPPHCLH